LELPATRFLKEDYPWRIQIKPFGTGGQIELLHQRFGVTELVVAFPGSVLDRIPVRPELNHITLVKKARHTRPI
jgi:hypothetical protein